MAFSGVKKRPSWIVSTIGLGVTVFLGLTACSSESAASGDGDQKASSWPVVEPSSFGDVSVDARPERVVASSFVMADISRSLGVEPIVVGTTGKSHADSTKNYPWLEGRFDSITDSGIFGESEKLNVEGIATYDPDLVLTASYSLDEELWSRISAVAPTYPGTSNVQDYDEKILAVSRLLTGSEDKGNEIISDTDSQFESFRKSNPGLGGKKFIYGGCTTSNKWTFGDGAILEDFGLVPSESQGEVTYEQLSVENLNFAESDIVIARCNEEQQRMLMESPNIGRPIESGETTIIWTDPKYSVNTAIQLAISGQMPSSMKWLIENLGPKLVDALNESH